MKKAVVVLCLMSMSLYSITMSPLMQTVDSKKSKNMIFTVKNPSKRPVVVDFSAMKLVGTNNNKETTEETKKVSIYPFSFAIASGGSQKVRVRYMGSALPELEEVYRIVATELDKSLEDEKDAKGTAEVSAQIKIRFSYSGLLFVKKPNFEAKLEIVNFERVSGSGIKIDIKNSGKASAVPIQSRYEFIVTIQNQRYKLTQDDLKKAEFRRILAGKTNTFVLKNAQLPEGKIESIQLQRK